MAESMTEAGALAELDLAVYEALIAPPGQSLETLTRALSRSAAELEVSLARLVDLSLVRRTQDGLNLAVNPSLAESQALGVEELELSTRRTAMECRRSAILNVAPQWAAAMRRSVASNAVDVVYNPDAITNVLMHYAETCRTEVLSVQPGRLNGRLGVGGAKATIHGLQRGVKMRELFQHVALRERASVAVMRELSDHGAQIRLATSLPGRSLVVDGEVALLPIPHVELRSGLAVVREPNVVAWVIATFEQLWSEATTLEEVFGSQLAAPAVDPTRAAILRLMGEGEKDEAISRRLSISVRTCRRHIADYMAQVGATSRFQAGVIAAREGHLESAPAG
jgi:DNA-binding CsgD family transcriptional regulator